MTPTDALIEKMARALCVADKSYEHWDDASAYMQRHYRKLARVARAAYDAYLSKGGGE